MMISHRKDGCRLVYVMIFVLLIVLKDIDGLDMILRVVLFLSFFLRL
jgi:hypothetical protein